MALDDTRLVRPPDRLVTRSFVMLGLAELAYFTADGVAVYALPVYVTGLLGSDAAGAGLAFGAFAIVALVCRPFVGRLADSRGRQPVMLAGALLCAAGMALTPLAGTLAGVVALRLFLGVAEAAFFVAAVAALVDLAPRSRMGEAMSYNSLGLYLGLTVGPPLGELLVRTAGFAVAWSVAAVLAAVAGAIVLTIGETRPAAAREPGESGPLIHWPSVPVGLVFLASMVAMGGFLAFAALHADAVGLGNASVPLLVYGAMVVAVRVAFARLPDRLPPLVLGAAAVLTMAAGLVVLAAWATPAGALLGAAVMGLGIAFSTPALFAAIFARAGAGERGAASATASAFVDLGIGGGPVVLGLVAQVATIPGAFGVAAGIALLGGTWALALRARERGVAVAA
ncbi:MFS transporter [Georgenia yuyongxinii]|uniref:MFS transporter n=1 Tax=Georgenia yuyongxinii TaxID=2589797 RepID=A0A552WPC7_9MICO|nr:MFS transporter [Georgenia yuyongxinii]TRW44638.1 MFS transporter [Georgenia yuyongxinii]